MRVSVLHWIGGALVAGIFVGCGGGAPSPQTQLDNAEWEVRLESDLDTLEVAVGDTTGMATQATYPVSAPAEESAGNAAVVAAGGVAVGESIPPDAREFTPGWRVQIYASSNLQLADDKAAEFRAVSTQPVYVEYEPPFYKVRVGDFLLRQDAERFRAEVLSDGWDGAWVTETLVLRPN